MNSLNLNRIVKISRPKFWHYTAGPFLLGATYAYTHSSLDSLQFTLLIIGFIWFLTLGNYFIYGVNDLVDQDTDKFNIKKNNQDEIKFQKKEEFTTKVLLTLIAISGLGFFLINIAAGWWYLAFLFFAHQYSAKPIRAKALPFLDGIFNILYILPAAVALQIANISISNQVLAIATFWAMAMHAISAIPDIKADQKAGLTTTAVLLKRNGTLIYCTFLYIFISILYPNFYINILTIPYILLAVISIFDQRIEIKNIYPFYPFLNLIIGAILFFMIFFIL